MDLQTSIEKLYMVGPVYAKRLAKLGILTVEDLLYHFPRRYDDYSLISTINRVQPGETVTIKAEIKSIKNEFTKNGKRMQKAVVDDGTREMEIVWFNQMFLTRTIKINEIYHFSGKVDWFGRKIVMISPKYEKITENIIHTGRLVPVYPETYGVSSKWLRSRINPLLTQCTDNLYEYLPYSIIKNNDLIGYKEAIEQIHFPENKEQIELAKKRLSFDELFLIQLASLQKKAEWNREIVGHQFESASWRIQIQDFIDKLPFELTMAQNRVIKEIFADLSKKQPMNRLLQGDVGSGKTVVAAIAMYLARLNGYQSIIMAPTEILANQHYETLKNLLEPFGIKVGLITASSRHSGLSRIDSGVGLRPPQNDVFVGTHALLNKKVKFQNVGLVVIDEQHRFGVEQRQKLKERGINPHLLTMTATPIPRTVALTLYGELDLSFLEEMPTGRIKIKTWVVAPEKRTAAYQWIRTRVKNTNEQAFIICPLIEESETMQSIKAATKEYDYLKTKVFPDLKLGLLHGRLKSKEKSKIMKDFQNGDLDILVATPVVEVGLDIPNATIMMIEDAERMGLAQLHQLRGRVGRRSFQSYCLLFSEAEQTTRLKAMEKINNGSELAELDLRLRGPGEIYGTHQHGIPDLKLASLADFKLIEKTRKAAELIIKEDSDLIQFPLLKEKLKKYKIKTVTTD